MTKVFDFVYCFRLNVFTSKISNLLLPCGLKGLEAVNLTQPINISTMLFNDLFIYFVVVFPLFGTSKELIRDSQRQSFCNFVGL